MTNFQRLSLPCIDCGHFHADESAGFVCTTKIPEGGGAVTCDCPRRDFIDDTKNAVGAEPAGLGELIARQEKEERELYNGRTPDEKEIADLRMRHSQENFELGQPTTFEERAAMFSSSLAAVPGDYEIPSEAALREALGEWPSYQSHKVVRALQIAEIFWREGLNYPGDDPINVAMRSVHGRGAVIVPATGPDGTQYKPFGLDQSFMERHTPVVGGFIVKYPDGYVSFSPAEPFESGYASLRAVDPAPPTNYVPDERMAALVDNLFRWHEPKGDQTVRFGRIRETARMFAEQMIVECPQSAELTLALRALHLAMMHANSAIACNE